MLTRKNVKERQERFEQIYKMYFDGYSYRGIAAEMGISAERVRQILYKYGSPSEILALQNEIDKRRETSWQTKEIEALLDVGNTCSAVAKTLNISIDVVKRVSARYRKAKAQTVRS